jgi:uncharacterized protein YfkK (UPF0435 family)
MDIMAQSHSQHLNDTIQALSDFDSLDGRDLRRIDGWINALQSADSKELKPIADMLGQLRDELGKDQADNAAVMRLIGQLGEQTTKAASMADGELGDKIKQLGQTLSKAGKR